MTPIPLHRTLFALLVAGLAAAAIAAPAAPAPNGNDSCLMCHGDKDAKDAAGKSIAVDGAKFGKSAHGGAGLKCTNCHADIVADKLPHRDRQKPVQCASCHDQAVKDYAATVHGVSRKGGNDAAASCADCHGTHDIRPSKDPESRTNHANLQATCLRCHGAEAVKAGLPGGDIGSKFDDSIHGKALKGAARASAPECTDCHGTHDMRPKSDPASKVSRERSPDTCGSCHKPEREAWANGMHGKLRQGGVLAAPGCTDCHSAHGIQQHDTAKFQLQVIEECGTCHGDYVDTYRDTFHGQVTALGYARMATCASCHGAHDVLPASNPASKVSKENRLATCQACHAGASANFASFDPHANKHDKVRSPLYYYAARFMEILLLGVFAFFGVHTAFWFYRELREKLSRGGNGKEKH
jgi:nitrate/TMAO reductase-like tetraheme cytochrome c subunit